jgi:uncharacterized protein (TIGR02246 family)
MVGRRTLVVGLASEVISLTALAQAQPTTAVEEQDLRKALVQYEQAWNGHDVNAWSNFLTDDIWFTQAWDSYGRQKGRENAVNLFKSNFLDSDLTQHVDRVRFMPDGTATVAMRVSFSYLPKTDGKYRIVFDKDPAISRWRKEGGRWRMFFFTSDKGWAIDQLKKDGLE